MNKTTIEYRWSTRMGEWVWLPAVREAKPTARFWEWINGGWVKLSLRPGTHAEVYSSERHEEGHSWESQVWDYEGDGTVEYCRNSGGTDCDGRHGNHDEYHCALDRLFAQEPYQPNPGEDWATPPSGQPAWGRGNCTQYDHNAELAGY